MHYISSYVCARKNKPSRPRCALISRSYRSPILPFVFLVFFFLARSISEREPPFPARNATELMSAPVCGPRAHVVTYVTHVAAAVGSHARALVKECSTGVPPTPHALPSLALRAHVCCMCRSIHYAPVIAGPGHSHPLVSDPLAFLRVEDRNPWRIDKFLHF